MLALAMNVSKYDSPTVCNALRYMCETPLKVTRLLAAFLNELTSTFSFRTVSIVGSTAFFPDYEPETNDSAVNRRTKLAYREQ